MGILTVTGGVVWFAFTAIIAFIVIRALLATVVTVIVVPFCLYQRYKAIPHFGKLKGAGSFSTYIWKMVFFADSERFDGSGYYFERKNGRFSFGKKPYSEPKRVRIIPRRKDGTP